MARILLVEDDPDVKLLLEHVLLSAGHDVTAVETATSAFMLVAAQPFDVAIADARLVDGSGIEVADRAADKGVSTIVITGNALQLRASELTRHDLLLKPMRAQELLSAIDRHMAKRAGHAGVVAFRKPG